MKGKITMNILVLSDKFKNTISSKKIGSICKNVFEKQNHHVTYFPISDGGDGFLDSINYAHQMTKVYCSTYDADGHKIKTYYLRKDNIAYIEIAKIIGVRKNSSYDILNASSYGLGKVILHAIKNKADTFYIGLGGSLTNDAGYGMLLALGYQFNKDKILIPNIIKNKQLTFHIVSDVTNPLCGRNGATYVFSKQKGATKKQMPILENKILNLSTIINNYYHSDYTQFKGAGAAGGLGYCFLSVLNATFHLGIDFILDYLHIDEMINQYDLIITGEGKIDHQSLNGKIVMEILKKYHKPTLLICAINELKKKPKDKNLIDIYSIIPCIANQKEALEKPAICLKKLLKTIKL